MSAIEWTDVTWNPVTGCTRVSPGCDRCYMYRIYPRLRAMGAHGYQTEPDDVRLMPDRLRQPLAWRKPRMAFVCSMSDAFHPRIPLDYIDKMFGVMAQAHADRGHIFQILTKRPGRAAEWWRMRGAAQYPDGLPAGIWMGTSIEAQKYAPRIDCIERIHAAVRFVSAEPLQWVIAGGESGPGARHMRPQWARALRDQCAAAGVAFFLKQLGGEYDQRGGDKALLDGRLHRGMPV